MSFRDSGGRTVPTPSKRRPLIYLGTGPHTLAPDRVSSRQKVFVHNLLRFSTLIVSVPTDPPCSRKEFVLSGSF